MFTETFDKLFAGSKGFPNGAITYSSADGIQTPVIGVFAGAPTWNNDDDGNLEVTYQLKQEGNQREVGRPCVSDVFRMFHGSLTCNSRSSTLSMSLSLSASAPAASLLMALKPSRTK